MTKSNPLHVAISYEKHLETAAVIRSLPHIKTWTCLEQSVTLERVAAFIVQRSRRAVLSSYDLDFASDEHTG